MPPVRRALISVYDKTGVVNFARRLHQLGIEIISTGGTANVLTDAGIPLRTVEQVTGFPEFLDGRVKTLHPAIHGGILARRDHPDHTTALERLRIGLIDLVAVSLYPFEKIAARPNSNRTDIIEMIDIGGVTLLRAAAKNFQDVVVISDANQYDFVLNSLEQNGGDCPLEMRQNLAKEAFTRLSAYDAAIANWLNISPVGGDQPSKQIFVPPSVEGGNIRGVVSIEQDKVFNRKLSTGLWKVMDLRYGENPHQKAAFYVENENLTLPWNQLQGIELSFNNLQDLDAARRLAGEFTEPACAILKHTTPCGVGIGDSIVEAFKRALATDPKSAYGGVVAINRAFNAEITQVMSGIFFEVIAAPQFEPEALTILSKRKKLRLLETPIPPHSDETTGPDIRRIRGGLLVQDWDEGFPELDELKVVTKRNPTPEEMDTLKFAWKVVKHVKSNAIIYCSRYATLGIGAGQMSRVDAAEMAALKAKQVDLDLHDSVAASDAFFPFRDGVDTIAATGATAVIQPGGSIRDQEAIDAANEHNLAMVFTGRRHFRH
jgi:phosphoribosylaminoimidazolecarboxamide formyltransferase/IMP cyclohydrolase